MANSRRTPGRTLFELRRRTETVNKARTRQLIAAVQAKEAGASWAQIAEACGMASKQLAQYTFREWRTDGTHLWREPKLPS